MMLSKGYSLLKVKSEMELDPEAEEPAIIPKSRMASFQFNLAGLACRSTCFVLFITGVVIIVSTLGWTPSDRYCAAQLSIWSPLLEAVEYEERDWENTYIIGDSGFTGPPTAELEAKWINVSQGN
ncbi:hypothetical protein CH063_13478, partial [Colletotrichum higginsianum]